MTKNDVQDYESICSELDRLSVLMLDAMKEYVDCKVMLENYIKTGSLHLAKARYIMGNKNVSSLQLPTEDCDILAQTRVSRAMQKSGSSESLVFELSRLSVKDEPEANGVKRRLSKANKECESNEKNETRSKNKSKHSKSTENLSSNDGKRSNHADESDQSPKVVSISKDPMKWFGVLVPQNMKYAQSNFCTALDYVVQCANIQSEMNLIRSKYLALIKLKQIHVDNKDQVE